MHCRPTSSTDEMGPLRNTVGSLPAPGLTCPSACSLSPLMPEKLLVPCTRPWLFLGSWASFARPQSPRPSAWPTPATSHQAPQSMSEYPQLALGLFRLHSHYGLRIPYSFFQKAGLSSTPSHHIKTSGAGVSEPTAPRAWPVLRRGPEQSTGNTSTSSSKFYCNLNPLIMWEGWGGGTPGTDARFPIHSMEPEVQLAVPRLFPGPPPIRVSWRLS